MSFAFYTERLRVGRRESLLQEQRQAVGLRRMRAELARGRRGNARPSVNRRTASVQNRDHPGSAELMDQVSD